MLTLLKLGGSLITEKSKACEINQDILDRLCAEIARSRKQFPEVQIILGHGSGSFGHIPAQKYRTREGVSTNQQWLGFAEVYHQARALNNAVITALHRHGVPAVAFPVSSSAYRDNCGKVSWDLRPLSAALEHHLLPVVYGDVLFDESIGGTILSTEEIFEILAHRLPVNRILIAGKEAGVFADFPVNHRLIRYISARNHSPEKVLLKGSSAIDVTGGMASKVQLMLQIVTRNPAIIARIFSGLEPGSINKALADEETGTTIAWEEEGYHDRR